MLSIINGGMLSTVQDLGRFGVMKDGFTQSGAMDQYSMKLANALCGNEPNSPVIEMTALGITARFTDEHIFCLCGGDFGATLNGKPIERSRSYKASAGNILTVGGARSGMRCCLAIAGGFAVPEVMGSASTNLKLGIGGYAGRKLRAGDILPVGVPSNRAKAGKTAPVREFGGGCVRLRVIMGPQDDMFTETDKALFLRQHYTATAGLDRMGLRLSGIALKGKNGTDIISDGIVFGSVQITRSGMPIILAADHQTTGGYAKIATVISVDLPLLAQVKPFDTLCFSSVSVRQAERLAAKEKKFFDKLFR